ncbi:MAG: TIGR03118 family protein [Mycobacterium sp.]|nr:TIGR03118 family protein [Mycobacterium sp.]
MRFTRRFGVVAIACGAFTIALTAGVAVGAAPSAHMRHAPTFKEVDRVSDQPGRAQLTDPALVNAWGLALGPTTPLWVADNGTDQATVYAGGVGRAPVTKVPLNVAIPGGAPTGVVFNDTKGFVVRGPGGKAPAAFIFVSEAGKVTAWNPTATPGPAVTVARVPGAIFKGAAILHTRFGPVLLATDFHNARIVAFDRKFHKIHLSSRFFSDRHIPKGYAPFNIAVLGRSVYVTYAKQDADAEDDVAGAGFGFVDRYSAFGLHVRRVASRGTLNAPWGLAIAPRSFGKFAGKLLVGNFGDGRINVFNRHSGDFRGQLLNRHHQPITIDGLWALLPGTATTGGTDAVWFSAGPDDESHGLLGQLRSTH